MLRHGIAHMALEAVAGMRQAEPAHQPVAGDLGDDRGRRHRQHQRVAGHHRLAVAAAIDLDMCRRRRRAAAHRQRLDRARQRPQRGAQDIVAVDALDRAEGDRHLRRGADFLVQLLALRGVELLGIVEPARDALGSRITAAATTGPASGPLPASSQPATGKMPLLSARRSRRKVGRRTGSASGNRWASSFAGHDARTMRGSCLSQSRRANACV